MIPKTRTEWWTEKINVNKARDKKNDKELKEGKWNIIRVYECELKTKKRETTLNNIIGTIQKTIL